VKTEDCRSINQITLWSLLHGEYIMKIGGKIALTDKGKDHLRDYVYAKPSMRLHEEELSERCRRLLHLVQQLRKTA
jgi:hypothetical protein